jgi:hypothetical protein
MIGEILPSFLPKNSAHNILYFFDNLPLFDLIAPGSVYEAPGGEGHSSHPPPSPPSPPPPHPRPRLKLEGGKEQKAKRFFVVILVD